VAEQCQEITSAAQRGTVAIVEEFFDIDVRVMEAKF
jgi:hypothetical protein